MKLVITSATFSLLRTKQIFENSQSMLTSMTRMQRMKAIMGWLHYSLWYMRNLHIYEPFLIDMTDAVCRMSTVRYWQVMRGKSF